MTNPAEKIRQVVEEHTFALTGSELFKGGKRTHLCHLVTAQEYMRYMAEKLLDVIIAEMEEYKNAILDDRQQDTMYEGGLRKAWNVTIAVLKNSRAALSDVSPNTKKL